MVLAVKSPCVPRSLPLLLVCLVSYNSDPGPFPPTLLVTCLLVLSQVSLVVVTFAKRNCDRYTELLAPLAPHGNVSKVRYLDINIDIENIFFAGFKF